MTLPQTCSSMLSEVSNESEGVMVIQLLLYISAYPFVHQSEITKTMSLVASMHLKAWSEIRIILLENQDIPITQIPYRIKTNYHLLNSKQVSLHWCFTTRHPHRCDHPHNKCKCQRDYFPAMPHGAPGSCSMRHVLHKKHLPLQANITTDCVPYLISSSGFPSATTSSYFISAPKGRWWLSLLLTPAWCNQSSYKEFLSIKTKMFIEKHHIWLCLPCSFSSLN